ncbi:hypothetical protein FXV83_17870 [Bradyrhizobium hipponense]|uniref:Uncharacterized protein n=1 Tax=Bradyrhizobium hipponense TaxID=2605638 RepID=A0A5S4YM74_9BRAD|nr:hypothetical protein [Bradyrhizobium hipponense]TYO65238.1 hypothetical protein FXV83_17870 [Bradyrhizobium hipponense]
MRAISLASAISALIALPAHATMIDWPAEVAHCRALRENIAPLLQAGQGISAVGRSSVAARRCVWIERRASRKKIPGAEPR